MPPQAPSASPRALGRHGGGQDRQRQRHHDRAADALQRPGGVERADRGSERGRGRAAVKIVEPDREHPPAAEAVAERGAGQQQHGEGERVGVDRPLEPVETRAEVAADHRQRGRDDEVVERDHEDRDRGDRERPQRFRRHPLRDRGRARRDGGS